MLQNLLLVQRENNRGNRREIAHLQGEPEIQHPTQYARGWVLPLLALVHLVEQSGEGALEVEFLLLALGLALVESGQSLL